MSAYINKCHNRWQVIMYNSLYRNNSSRTKHIATVKTKEEAQKICDKVNKEEREQYTMPQEIIEEWANLHQNGSYTLKDIMHKYQVPLKYVKEQLKAYSEQSDWYNYWHAREHGLKTDMYIANVNDETTASVYQTFIQTMKSLGKTTAQAWQEIYKITGETMPDMEANSET